MGSGSDGAWGSSISPTDSVFSTGGVTCSCGSTLSATTVGALVCATCSVESASTAVDSTFSVGPVTSVASAAAGTASSSVFAGEGSVDTSSFTVASICIADSATLSTA